jgi:spermidine/putrescine transport system ATP-binding protein
VTHDQEEAMTMSNRLAVMRHGHIEQLGAPEDVYEHPATEFVAGFLGASNLLDGEVAALNGTATVRLPTGETIAADDTSVGAPVGSPVKVGVRPEKISIVPEEGGETAGRNRITGTVRMATYIGVNYQYKVDGPGGRELTVFVQNQGAAGSNPAVGQRVRLEWLPEHTFVVEPSDEPFEEEDEA